MRKFIDGNGNDSSAAALAFLKTHPISYQADLYVIKTGPTYAGQYLDRTFLVTNWTTPIQYPPRGTFFTTKLINRGEVKSEISTDAAKLQVDWCPRDSDILAVSNTSAVLLTALQGFEAQVFDNGTVEVWRTIMPTPGDASTYGACNMFTGRIGDCQVDRVATKLSVISRMETLNVQIPTNTIEPNNMYGQYNTGMLPPGVTNPFTILAGSTRFKLFCSPAVTNFGQFNTGYLIIQTGQTAGTHRRIMNQTIEGGDTVFYLEFPLPFAALPGDTLNAFVSLPLDFATSVALGVPFAGFPFVPNPLDTVMIT